MRRRMALLLLALCPSVTDALPRYGLSGRLGAPKGNVPLWTIYSTSNQEELRVPPEHALKGFLTDVFPAGPSSAFLVDASTFARALSSTAQVFRLGSPVNQPVWTDAKTHEHWLVVYLGYGAYATAWDLRFVNISETCIRFGYGRSRAPDSEKRHYFYWVPVGKVRPGWIQLELFDEDRHDIVFTRAVRVGLFSELPKEVTKVNGTKVPLDRISCTGQPFLSNVRLDCKDKETAQNLHDLAESSRPGGPSNVFLLAAKDTAAAVRSSWYTVSRSIPVDSLQNSDEDIWLFASLGRYPYGYWSVETLTVDGETIRLSYKKSKAHTHHCRHYYWACLGKLAKGSYEVELFNIEEQRVEVSRRVSVGTQEPKR